MRFATIALSAVLSTALAGVAFAGSERFAEALDLSPEQQTVVESFREEMKEARSEVKEARQAFREAMKAEIEGGDPDVKKLQKLADAAAEAQQDAAYLAIDHMAELSEVLTDEQIETFLELKEERRERRGEGRGHGRGEGRGGR